ncbi:MAG TPA: hypothetical protein VFH50_03790 [Acidimicrobiales bacterium]|nr:hypothetical protein [Acidimicrobiales bacterium]
MTGPTLALPVIGPLIRDTIGTAVHGIVDVIAAPVASAAAWVLRGVGALIDATTRPQLDRGWFQARYSVMVALAVITLVGVLAVSAVHAVVRQDPGLVLRVMVVQLPMAVILTGAAAGIVQWSLSLVDLLCNAVTADTGHDVQHLFVTMETYLLAAGVASGGAVPPFVILAVSLLVVVGGLLLWMELLLRSLAVDAATLFLPLAMVTLAWPAASRVARRLAETIAALVLSKLVIVGVLSLAVGALSAGGFGALLTGMGLLLLAAGAPYTLLRLIPMAEFGAVAHMEGLTRRATVRPAMTAWSARSLLPVGGGGPGPGYVGPEEDAPAGGSAVPADLSSSGIRQRQGDFSGPLYDAVSTLRVDGGPDGGAGAGGPDGRDEPPAALP